MVSELDHNEPGLTKTMSNEKEAAAVSVHVVPGHEQEAATAEDVVAAEEEFTCVRQALRSRMTDTRQFSRVQATVAQS